MCIGDHTLAVVETFTYLGSNISNNLSLDVEVNVRIGKSTTTYGPSSKEGVGQHHSDTQHQDEGVSSLHAEHSPLWQ